jgi:hypothetical protein
MFPKWLEGKASLRLIRDAKMFYDSDYSGLNPEIHGVIY